MVDRGGLENRCGFAPTVGSNPTLSATYPIDSAAFSLFGEFFSLIPWVSLFGFRRRPVIHSRSPRFAAPVSAGLMGRLGLTGSKNRELSGKAGLWGRFRHFCAVESIALPVGYIRIPCSTITGKENRPNRERNSLDQGKNWRKQGGVFQEKSWSCSAQSSAMSVAIRLATLSWGGCLPSRIAVCRVGDRKARGRRRRI